MGSGFPGFPKEGIQFFRGLARNNNRDWFQPRKAQFDEQVKRPMLELVDALNRGMAGFAPEYVTEPERAIYRIYRDTRFSKDKTPYKNHIAASFVRHGMPKNGSGGYYFSVSDKEIEVGGGVYLPERDALLAIRQHIAANWEALGRITGTRAVKRLLGDVQGDQLSRVPKGFPADHPAAGLLRLKYYVLFVTLPPEIATTPQLYTEVLKRFKAMAPFIEFLHAPLARAKALPARPKNGHFNDRQLPVDF
jgi:uncharacterized protein (TIGR02453 family)